MIIPTFLLSTVLVWDCRTHTVPGMTPPTTVAPQSPNLAPSTRMCPASTNIVHTVSDSTHPSSQACLQQPQESLALGTLICLLVRAGAVKSSGVLVTWPARVVSVLSLN